MCYVFYCFAVDSGAYLSLKDAALPNFFNKMAHKLSPDVNKINADGLTKLQVAIADNDLARIMTLIKAGADINFRGMQVEPPLHMALDRRKHHIAIALVQAGADLNLQDAYGRTPLHHAVQQGNETFILTLLKLGADPNIADDNGQTPLFMMHDGYPSLVDTLVSAGANVNAQDHLGRTPLRHYTGRDGVIRRLLANKADANLPDRDGVTPFSALLEDDAIQRHYHSLFLMVHQGRADLSARNRAGESLLHVAGRLGLGDMFDTALARASHGFVDARGNTALHALMRQCNTALVARLLSHAPHLATRANQTGRTPLAEIVQRTVEPQQRITDNVTDAARRLIRCGADVNTASSTGTTLLHHAVAFKNADLVQFLSDHGADLDARDHAGRAPLHIAIADKNLDMLDALLDLGADPDLTDARGWTVLDRLAEKQDRDSPIVQRLIVGGGSYRKQLPLNPAQMRPEAAPQAQRRQIESQDLNNKTVNDISEQMSRAAQDKRGEARMDQRGEPRPDQRPPLETLSQKPALRKKPAAGSVNDSAPPAAKPRRPSN